MKVRLAQPHLREVSARAAPAAPSHSRPGVIGLLTSITLPADSGLTVQLQERAGLRALHWHSAAGSACRAGGEGAGTSWGLHGPGPGRSGRVVEGLAWEAQSADSGQSRQDLQGPCLCRSPGPPRVILRRAGKPAPAATALACRLQGSRVLMEEVSRLVRAARPAAVPARNLPRMQCV